MSSDGKLKLNFVALLDTMEAGEVAYKERSKIYETLKNS